MAPHFTDEQTNVQRAITAPFLTPQKQNTHCIEYHLTLAQQLAIYKTADTARPIVTLTSRAPEEPYSSHETFSVLFCESNREMAGVIPG